MKAPHAQRYPLQSRKLLAAVMALSVPAGIVSSVAHAASGSWLGTTDGLWSDESNWSASPVPGVGEIATFDGAGNANTTIDLGAGVSIGSVVFDTASAAAYTIGSGAAGSQTLTFGSVRNIITMNSTVAANQLFNANLALSVSSTANSAATYYTVTNNSTTNPLTLAGGISASTTGVKTLHVTGAGNTAISGAITSGSGNVSLFKTGSGTLTLSGGATWSGLGITDAANFTTSAVFREGTTILNGGTYGNSNLELVIGGVATHGGAGTNTTLQLNNGTTLNNISWLSIGRGNGNGVATSNLTLNGNATVTTTNFSAGFNADNTGNLPKGDITLNGTSTLTVTSTATGTGVGASTFSLGESAGSEFTLTVNDNAVVNRAGGNTSLAGNNQNQGAFQIGRGGKGTVIMNGGTINVASTDLGRGVNNTTAQDGTLTIKAGATYNNEGDFRMAFAGGASGQATLNVQGGTLNIGTATARTMVIGTFDFSSATVNVDSGSLNLNTNSSIRFNARGNTGAKVFNLTGGSVTSYSDNATTANGAGVLDMMEFATATASNTFNLSGGTLTIRQVLSTGADGTRIFNFNGGTLRATGDSTAFFNLGTGGTTRANVRNGGAVIDTNGHNVTVAQALVHSNIGSDNATDGGLTKVGAGTLTLTGANTYTGLTTISAGTLAIGATGSIANTSGINLGTAGSQGTLDLTAKGSSFLGNVSGFGTINVGASNTVGIDGIFTPGNSAGIVSVTGNLALSDDGAATTMEVLSRNGGSPVAGTHFDQVVASGSISFGGTLTIDTTGLSGLTAGDSFTLFSAGSYTGDFQSVSIAGSFVASLSHDFDSDIWTGSSLNGYTFSFNETNGLFSVSAVPEPSAFAVFAGLAGLGFAASRRRRRVAA